MLQCTIDNVTRAARVWAELTPGPEHDVDWTTPHGVVLKTSSLTLRDFGGGAPGSEHPLLIVAPEVNGSNLADYGPGQSLVAVAKSAGFGRVCVLHWEQTLTHWIEAESPAEFYAAINRGQAQDVVGAVVHWSS